MAAGTGKKDEEEMKVEVGDWVRFFQNGVLVIGVVNYVKEDKWDSGKYECVTDIGSVGEEYIQEIRRKPK